MSSGATSLIGEREARGRFWCFLEDVSSGISVSVGVNPRRAVSALASSMKDVSCRSHHSYSTKTVGVSVPSTASMENAKILLSQTGWIMNG